MYFSLQKFKSVKNFFRVVGGWLCLLCYGEKITFAREVHTNANLNYHSGWFSKAAAEN